MLELVLISALLLQAPVPEQHLIDSLGIRDYFLDADGRRNPDLFRKDSLSAEGRHLLSRLVAEYNGEPAPDDGFVPYHQDSTVTAIGVTFVESDVLPEPSDSCIVMTGEQECLWRDSTVTRERLKFTIPESWQGKDVLVRLRDCGERIYCYLNGEFLGYCRDCGDFAQLDCGNLATAGENELVLKIFGEYLPERKIVTVCAGDCPAPKMCGNATPEGVLRGVHIRSRAAGGDAVERMRYARLNAAVVHDLQTAAFYESCLRYGISTYWEDAPEGEFLEETVLMSDPVSPELTRMRYTGQQFTFEDLGGGKVRITNRSPAEGSDGIRFTATLLRGGETIRNRPLLVKLAPSESREANTFGSDDMKVGNEYFVHLTARDEGWNVVSEGELRLGGAVDRTPVSLKGTKLSARQNGRATVVISNQTVSFAVNTETGSLKSLCIGKTEYLSSPIAPEDAPDGYEMRHDGSEVVLDFGTFKYILAPSGEFRAYGKFSFGTTMKDAVYYGRGPMDNTPEVCAGSFLGRFSTPASSAGSHCDVRYLILTDESRRLKLSSATPFHFSTEGSLVKLSRGAYHFKAE